jgi:hypothetical protein
MAENIQKAQKYSNLESINTNHSSFSHSQLQTHRGRINIRNQKSNTFIDKNLQKIVNVAPGGVITTDSDNSYSQMGRKFMNNLQLADDTNGGVNLDQVPAATGWNFLFDTVECRSKAGYNGHYTKTNQDTFFAEKSFLGDRNKALFGVFDGHGEHGHKVSGFLKRCINDKLMHQVKVLQSRPGFKSEIDEHIKVLFKESFVKLNDDLNKRFGIMTDQSGSTGCCVCCMNDKFYCANVGDSKAAILSRETKNWELIELSNDHTPDIPAEKQRILACGGRVDRSKRKFSFLND